MDDSNSDSKQARPYQGIISERLSMDDIAQLDDNVVRFIELLIKLQRQKEESDSLKE